MSQTKLPSSPALGPADQAYFDRLVAMAAAICQTPVALVNYFSDGWQHTAATTSICPDPMRREDSICTYTLEFGDLLVIPDTLADDRFKARHYVAGPPGIRFYAGIPITRLNGDAFGTLCVCDIVPRQLSPSQMGNLRQLGKLLSSALKSVA